jgi:arylsulfatase A-like enzyme
MSFQNRRRINEMNKQNLKLTGLAATLLLTGGCATPKKEQQPNLIFVFADQLRADRVGYSGDIRAHTPNLDKLSRQAMNFDNAVSMSPVSAAMRASLLTGKYTSSTGMVVNELRLNPDHVTFADVLDSSGYTTAYIGKWHLWSNVAGRHDSVAYAYTPPGPYRLGFNDVWKAYNFHHDNYHSYYFENKPEKIYYGDTVYEPEAQFDMAIDYLDKAARGDKPFALFLSVGIPHDPWTKRNVPARFYDMYRDSVFGYPPTWRDTPDPYMDRYKDQNQWIHYFKADLPEFQHVYYAMVASLDEQIGKLMKKIDELGLTKKTIFVFTSDHGEMMGEHGRIQKMIFYDPAARIPFLIRWPGKIPEGAKTDACLSTPDIMPTILGLMNLPIPKAVEGMNLSEVAEGQPGPEPEMAFLQGMGHTYLWIDGAEWRAVRDKEYTYARYLVDGSELLFDNKKDPLQMHNLVDDPAYIAVKYRLKTWMQAKMDSLNDRFMPCSWYRDHWTDGNRNITASARGPFKELPVTGDQGPVTSDR